VLDPVDLCFLDGESTPGQQGCHALAVREPSVLISNVHELLFQVMARMIICLHLTGEGLPS